MSNSKKNKIQFTFGHLSLMEIKSMLEVLPIDINFIDKTDLFQYYSKSDIFSRSPESLNKTVQECHSSLSIPMVNEILREFRKGSKNEIHFWQRKDDQLIFIWYIAVRSPKNEYLGTIEVIQDITHLQEVKGERKTLIWDK